MNHWVDEKRLEIIMVDQPLFLRMLNNILILLLLLLLLGMPVSVELSFAKIGINYVLVNLISIIHWY